MLAVFATAPNIALGQGVRALTEETRQAAITGKDAKDCQQVMQPLMLAARNDAAADLHYKEMQGDRGSKTKANDWVLWVLERFPYTTVIVTPYCGLAMDAAAAAREYKPFTPAPFDANDVQTVVIKVWAGSSFAAAESIKHFVVKRDGVLIQPLKAELETVQVQNRMGASREITRGDFTFPVEALAVGAKVTLVWIGPVRNWEFTFTPEELASLK
jgi:hypothetical protein